MQRADVMVLRACVLQCSRDVFSACSIPIDPCVVDVAELGMTGQVATFIGFGGALLRGTLTLVAPYALLHDAYPIPPRGGAQVSEAEVLDWSGELSNQLLGRIKNKLAARGVELMASTPKAMRVEQPRIQGSTSMTVCALLFHSGDARLGVWFDAVTSREEALFASTEGPVEECQMEGEMMLF